MRIEIDTLHDSPAEIRKAISLLQSLVEHPSIQPRNIFESSQDAAQPSPLLGTLFDDPPLNETKKIEPKIEYY